MRTSDIPWPEVIALAEKISELRPDIRPSLGARLAEFYTPDEAELWLTRPQPLLDGKTAVQMIAAGREDDLHRVLDNLDGQIAT